MKRYMAGLCATLILIVGAMTTPAGPARSQGLVEYALILVLVALNEGGPTSLAWYPAAGPGRGQAPGDAVTYTYIVTNLGPAGGQTCRQVVKATIPVGEGLNRMDLEIDSNSNSLLVNGKDVGNLDPCFQIAVDGDIIVEIGETLPPEATADLRGPGPWPAPDLLPAKGLRNVQHLWLDLGDVDGSAQCLPQGGYVVRTGG